MKRNRIFSIGALVVLALVLAACRGTITVEPIYISDREFSTSWEIRNASNEHVEYVACNNEDTWYQFRFNASSASAVASADVHIRGEDYGAVTIPVSRSDMYSDYGRDFVFEVRLEPERPYPMSLENDLEPTAIVVTPIPPEAVPAEGGMQHITATIRSSNGNAIGTIRRSIDVWGGC